MLTLEEVRGRYSNCDDYIGLHILRLVQLRRTEAGLGSSCAQVFEDVPLKKLVFRVINAPSLRDSVPASAADCILTEWMVQSHLSWFQVVLTPFELQEIRDCPVQRLWLTYALLCLQAGINKYHKLGRGGAAASAATTPKTSREWTRRRDYDPLSGN